MGYTKPKLERYGSLRQLTQIGLDSDCDGGVWGVVDGSNIGELFGVRCNRS